MGNRRERSKPAYNLDEAKLLVASGHLMVTRRPRDFIANRCGRYDTGRFMAELFADVQPSNFYKSEALDKFPGRWGDIYRHVEHDGDEWYVKFFIDGDQMKVAVLSASWDGYIH